MSRPTGFVGNVRIPTMWGSKMSDDKAKDGLFDGDSFERVIWEFPSEKEYRRWCSKFDKIIFSFSGGKDSMTMLSYMLDLGVPRRKMLVMFCATLCDYPDLEDFVYDYVVNKMKCKLVILGGKKPMEDRLTALEKLGYPHQATPKWCTRKWKIVPTENYVKKLRRQLGPTVNILYCIGWRAEESEHRAGAPRAFYDTVKKMWLTYPILDMKRGEVYEYLASKNIQLHPSYRYSERLGCICCYARNRKEWQGMRQQDPATFALGVEMIVRGATRPGVPSDRTADTLRKAYGLPSTMKAREANIYEGLKLHKGASKSKSKAQTKKGYR